MRRVMRQRRAHIVLCLTAAVALVTQLPAGTGFTRFHSCNRRLMLPSVQAKPVALGGTKVV